MIPALLPQLYFFSFFSHTSKFHCLLRLGFSIVVNSTDTRHASIGTFSKVRHLLMQASMSVLNMLLKRRFSACRALLNTKELDSIISKIPDNAPTLNENTEWLHRLSVDKRKISQTAIFGESDRETYLISNKTGLDTPDTNPDFISVKSKKTKVSFNVVRQPYFAKDMSSPYHIISIPATSYDVSSSPFSMKPSKQRPKSDRSQAFSDLKVVKLRSGGGGAGIVSFATDSGIPVGPPDGGDGGAGGDIYVMAVEGLSSLQGIRAKYTADDGTSGSSGQLDGKKGTNVIITVPVGTTIRWCPDPVEIRALQKKEHADKVFHVKAVPENAGENIPKYIQFFRDSYRPGQGWIFKDRNEEYHMERGYFKELRESVKTFDRQSDYDELRSDRFPIYGLDLAEPTSEPLLLIKGGRGGLGNMHFLTPNVRNPRFSKMGRAGLAESFIFELNLLADLGLVGLPNAGKSTLLRAISRARPRVGSWEFTTLEPNIGTISVGIDRPMFTVADIPGIVKGAKNDRGMGLNFLRHIERSGGIVFVVSLSVKDPISDLQVLENELGAQMLRGKNKLVVATKADLEGTECKFEDLTKYCLSKCFKCVPCSPKTRGNIDTVINLMAECSGKYD